MWLLLLKFSVNGDVRIIWPLILGGRFSPRQIKMIELIEPGSSPLMIRLIVRSLSSVCSANSFIVMWIGYTK